MNATVEQIQKDLNEYLHRVRDGETVVVFQGDAAVAELRPVGSSGAKGDLEQRRLKQLEEDLAKLDPREEQALAEEIYVGEVDWPEY